MDSALILATLTAEYDLRETMLARVASALAILGCVHSAPSGQFLLHQKEDVLRYDCFVITFHIVLRHGAVVLDSFLCQEVGGIGLLKQSITDVLLICQDLLYGAWVPSFFTCAGENPVSLQTGSNLIHAFSFEVFPVDPLNDFCLLRGQRGLTPLFGIGITGSAHSGIRIWKE